MKMKKQNKIKDTSNMKKETTILTIRIEKKLADKIKINASKENRTVTNYLETLLKKSIG